MNIIEHLLGGERKKNPICILRDHTEIMFLIKQVDAINKEFKRKVEELLDIANAESKIIWSDIESKLKDKDLIKTTEGLSYKNGALYQDEQ